MKKFLLLWFAGALVVAALLSSFNMTQLYPLTRKGIPVCGTLTGFEPNNHQEAHYSYEVNGKSYSGSQQGGTGDQQGALICRSDASGRNGYVVYYLPSDPGVSCLGNPGALFENEAVFVSLGMVFVPTLFLLGWRSRSSAFREWLDRGNKKTAI
jgi:hypothetical protein